MAKSNWELIQEIVAVSTGIGTILIGIGTVWAMLRVGGLEDYFLSEIAVRNEELTTSSEKLRKQSITQAQLQQDINRKTDELRGFQSKIASAEQTLRRYSIEERRISSLLDERLRTQTYQVLESAGYFNMVRMIDLNDTVRRTVEIGKLYVEAVTGAKSDPQNRPLKRYFDLADKGMRQSCPELYTANFILPESLPPPEYSRVSPANETVAEFNAAQKETSDRFSANWKKYKELADAREKALREGFDKFYRQADSCLCEVLAAGHSREAICKGAKWY